MAVNQTEKYWVTTYAPLWKHIDKRGGTVCYVPALSVIDTIGLINADHPNMVYVFYKTASKVFEGFMHVDYLEMLTVKNKTGLVPIENQTDNPIDAEQYIVWHGRVQYNLCGEFCVAKFASIGIEYFLEEWEKKNSSYFKYVFSGWNSKPTGLSELKDMADTLGITTERIDVLLKSNETRKVMFTPRRVRDFLQAYGPAIITVKIDYRGKLSTSGKLHWVLLERVFPDSIDDGFVELYNPFFNKIEEYSWDELVKSSRTFSGLFLKR